MLLILLPARHLTWKQPEKCAAGLLPATASMSALSTWDSTRIRTAAQKQVFCAARQILDACFTGAHLGGDVGRHGSQPGRYREGLGVILEVTRVVPVVQRASLQ